MHSMTIHLPVHLQDFLDHVIAQGLYSSASEYVQEVIRADARRIEETGLESQLLGGLKSSGIELNPAQWATIRAEARGRLRGR